MPGAIAAFSLLAEREGFGEWLPLQEPPILPPLLEPLSSTGASVGTDPALPDDPSTYHRPQSRRECLGADVKI